MRLKSVPHSCPLQPSPNERLCLRGPRSPSYKQFPGQPIRQGVLVVGPFSSGAALLRGRKCAGSHMPRVIAHRRTPQ